MADPALLDRIYEAAALPALWPGVLETICDGVGAFGATMIMHDAHGPSIIPTPRLEQTVSDYIAGGWAADPTYAAPLLADLYPGFRAETHYRTVEEIERLPVHVEFLAPRGLIASVGTVLQGTRDDMLQIALEGLPSYAAAEAAAPWLDELRAPLARALSLSALLRDQRSSVAVTALDLAGVGAAVVAREGRLRAVNDRFAKRLGATIDTRAGRLRFADRFVQGQLDAALLALRDGAGIGSVAMAAQDDAPPLVLHLLPLRRVAREVFGADGVLILLAEAANATVPTADILRLLFDLTPAEARLTRKLVEGHSISDAARGLGITEATARTHLGRIFAKTGVHRQAELVRLLAGLGAPA